MSLYYVARLTPYLDLKSLKIQRSGFDFKSNLTSAIGDLVNRNIQRDLFPATMPWPMTLAPMNEAVRRENHAKKNLYKEKKLTVTIQEVMKDVRIVLLSKKWKILQEWEKN
jgi:hypothetical protein